MSRISALVALALLSCDPGLELPPSARGDAGLVEPRFEPPECCELPPNFRFSLPTAPRAPFPLLFEGELSDYHQSRLDGPLPSTLEVRRVPLGAVSRRDGTWFAPLAPLTPGALYSLAGSERDVLELVVREAASAEFRRVWPLDADPTRFAVFCSTEQARHGAVALSQGLTALVIPGDNRCFGLLREPGGEPLFSPRELFGAAVQTTVLSGVLTPAAEPTRLVCDEAESRFAIGCARVEDDRLTFRAPVDSYWLFSGAAWGGVGVAAAARGALSGLPSQSEVSLSVRVFTRDGRELESELVVHTAAPRPHLVLNEVLADANGSEPEQEWVELYNDGGESVELGGFGFSDSDLAAAVPLPAHVLPPGEFALIVDEDYDAVSDLDLGPLAGTPLLRVPSLGQYGLANGGERLSLYSPEGALLSRVPALPARPGQSLARRSPDCPDEAACFALHAPPGASPGAPNETR